MQADKKPLISLNIFENEDNFELKLNVSTRFLTEVSNQFEKKKNRISNDRRHRRTY